MRVLFFAHLKDVTGCAETTVPGDRIDVDALWRRLTDAYPGLGPLRSSIRLARNSEYVGPGVLLGAEDEIALIPPVSGG